MKQHIGLFTGKPGKSTDRKSVCQRGLFHGASDTASGGEVSLGIPSDENGSSQFHSDVPGISDRIYCSILLWSNTDFPQDDHLRNHVGILTLVNRVQAPVMGLAQQIPKVVSILASAGRIMELQQIPLEMKTDTQIPSAQVGVEIKDMTFGYTDETVLENVNLRIEPGEFVAIIGESGIGKTTLIRIIMSFMSNIRGSVTFLMKKGIWSGRMPLPGNLYLMYPRGIHCSAVRCGRISVWGNWMQRRKKCMRH